MIVIFLEIEIRYIAETTYDYDTLSSYVQDNYPTLTNNQQVAYNTILQNILQNTG